MPLCTHQARHGEEFCARECPLAPTAALAGIFRHEWVGVGRGVPAADARTVDVAILDMNHGWPNLSHDSLVRLVRGAACDLADSIGRAGLAVRVLSYDVRAGLRVPEHDPRFGLYLGTGGPGQLDPRANDASSEGSQGVKEDPAWEAPLFRLFDDVAADPNAALLAVCHTFGLLCRWSGIAAPVMRGEAKGGKSAGVLENLLDDTAMHHPWFSRFARHLPAKRRFRIMDSRLFDLIANGAATRGATVLAHETRGLGGARGESMTMAEFARNEGDAMPRMLGVNHHPEIVRRASLMRLLKDKLDNGVVTFDWYSERVRLLNTHYPGEDSTHRIELTSYYTLTAPLRFHLTRALRRRAESLGQTFGANESAVLTAEEVRPRAERREKKAAPAPPR